ncbi:tRNA (adenosine(37)-N6)-threonylcarbamoyltransferase complex dimerization subunit type 1 TsaB [Undibacterium sp. Jales W-56]|uniref:tRNA (adenosine(37)-N6)-threonylcarbamoyltransferase complex dimerization subunit type 1 TsaB n=1 Tax=Undibacterium sp. Jales W-56 TaxID=2897325 RepID=UPI0021D06AAF|nr:tRNA (adenosine(37)-N6)-threonylcarbamoyltransferase complex dimerization subunit type 1 TsaB [Undibacterium sp. Jales W-56]MCU6433515.1 tRNA (adenosine(37)-N6)-threonylcarbamoyltransferase complex dimerization subunit type 1 TsaB [Undibacterium sp. Jales W-56]
MTTLLAIETSTELASVALMTGDSMISRELSGVQTHSQGILPAIQALLLDAGITLQQCDAIAFGCGPGAFTGVRTACGIVQGLAFGAELPVLPIISLYAMAEAARQLSDATDFVCVLDARMEEVYWAQYRYADGKWSELVAPVLSKAADIDVVPQTDNLVYALGHGVVLGQLDKTHRQVLCMPHARQVATLAIRNFDAGLCLDAAQAQPLYLRNKIALTTAERQQLKEAV